MRKLMPLTSTQLVGVILALGAVVSTTDVIATTAPAALSAPHAADTPAHDRSGPRGIGWD
jgi:hypothetical protein